MSDSYILLRNGKLVLHNPDDTLQCVRQDILIKGNTIVEIARDIVAPSSDTNVVQCEDLIISPGFVDAHHHLWETQLKGRHVDETLLQYALTGNFASSLYTSDDVFWGTLGGALECLDAGTTAVVAYEHIAYSEGHVRKGLEGLSASGIRGIFATTPTMRVKTWSPFSFEEELIPAWWSSMYSELAKASPFAGGRIALGLGIDSYYLPEERCKEIILGARAAGAKIVSSHMSLSNNTAAALEEMKLLDEDIVLVHANHITDTDLLAVKTAGAHLCSTPLTEMQMTHGHPICFKAVAHETGSLGVDCHSMKSGSLVEEMRVALAHARAMFNEDYRLEHGRENLNLPFKAANAFNLATIKGARAIGMEGEIGSIAVGKRADLVFFETDTPAMIAGAEHDPVAAIVAHSSVRDVAVVMVDGVFRKNDGRLSPVGMKDGTILSWKTVGQEILRSRAEIQKRVEAIDYSVAVPQAMKAYAEVVKK